MTIVNRSPYLKNDRTFPTDADMLSREMDRAYIEIAQSINERTIGVYPSNKPSITGNSYYPTSQKQPSLRQIYPITSTTAFNHNIDFNTVSYMGNCYGSYTDGINWYGLMFMNNVTAPAGQIIFSLSSSQVLFGIGAGSPTVTKGIIVLEWITNL